MISRFCPTVLRATAIVSFVGVCAVAGPILAQQQNQNTALFARAWALEVPTETAIRFEPCGNQVCGRVVALGQQSEEGALSTRDVNNPNPTQRNRPLCGLVIVQGLTATPRGWTGGTVYDPIEGKIMRANITMDRRGEFRLTLPSLPPLFNNIALVPAAGTSNRPCAS